jgi:hypothetical protein
MIKNIAQRWSALALCAAVLALAGCAAPAEKGNMAVAPIATTKKLPYSVAVTTRGGSETGAMDSSNVSNADLKAALEASITKSSLFKSVVQGKDGDYELSVTVTQLNKPVFGASFTVTMDAGWSLVKASDKSVAMRKSISSTYTATMSDSLVGATRMRLAVEGVVRENITQGMKAISDSGI